MKEPRCIAQLLRRESPNPINFTITHGRGRKGIIIRTRKAGVIEKLCCLVKKRGLWL
ncbi:Uncharacterised protein [Enterobacter ludwigii]|nr:Uncharacterised protein [Enterobacter ludwigii]SAG71258.1 Uncharacterised protein [Enterobacter ludwigii]